MNEIYGNLIKLAQDGEFDLIAQGCNCFCRMRSGIAPQIAKAFPDAERVDKETISGDYRKLGNYSVGKVYKYKKLIMEVVNCYTQHRYGREENVIYLDYEALTLCLRKINHNWPGKHIGLPLIGCGLAHGDWIIVQEIYKRELTNLTTTVVHFKQ